MKLSSLCGGLVLSLFGTQSVAPPLEITQKPRLCGYTFQEAEKKLIQRGEMWGGEGYSKPLLADLMNEHKGGGKIMFFSYSHPHSWTYYHYDIIGWEFDGSTQMYGGVNSEEKVLINQSGYEAFCDTFLPQKISINL